MCRDSTTTVFWSLQWGARAADEPPCGRRAATLRAHARVAAVVSVGAGVLLPLSHGLRLCRIHAGVRCGELSGPDVRVAWTSIWRTDVIGLRTQVLGRDRRLTRPLLTPRRRSSCHRRRCSRLLSRSRSARPRTPRGLASPPVFLELAFAMFRGRGGVDLMAAPTPLPAWHRRVGAGVRDRSALGTDSRACAVRLCRGGGRRDRHAVRGFGPRATDGSFTDGGQRWMTSGESRSSRSTSSNCRD